MKLSAENSPLLKFSHSSHGDVSRNPTHEEEEETLRIGSIGTAGRVRPIVFSFRASRAASSDASSVKYFLLSLTLSCA